MMRASILDEKYKGSAFGLSRYWEMQDILYYYASASSWSSRNKPRILPENKIKPTCVTGGGKEELTSMWNCRVERLQY